MKLEPAVFNPECTTIWSFHDRGDWATHKGDYRGNFSPYIPRNVILRYSKENDLVLDPMCGSGTTLVECKLLNRNTIGIDVNKSAIELTKKRLSFPFNTQSKQKVGVGDARNLKLRAESIDLIIAHPPYLDIIKYNPQNKGDLSNIHDVSEFVSEIKKIAQESFRVLKPGKFCAILMGDTRRSGLYIPLSHHVMQAFLECGFKLKEDVIKQQYNCATTSYWRSQSEKYNFLLIMHEHLFIFKK